MIREVEMGPFKHTVDDGLDLRKAAFECMYTLLETCLDRLDIFEFLNHVEDGLRDHYDIKVHATFFCSKVAYVSLCVVRRGDGVLSFLFQQMLTFLLIVRLSHLRPNALLQREY